MTMGLLLVCCRLVVLSLLSISMSGHVKVRVPPQTAAPPLRARSFEVRDEGGRGKAHALFRGLSHAERDRVLSGQRVAPAVETGGG